MGRRLLNAAVGLAAFACLLAGVGVVRAVVGEPDPFAIVAILSWFVAGVLILLCAIAALTLVYSLLHDVGEDIVKAARRHSGSGR